MNLDRIRAGAALVSGMPSREQFRRVIADLPERNTVTHDDPHVEDGHCLCACPLCVSDWRQMSGGGARRFCICPDCKGGDCPNWRLDREMFDRIQAATAEPEATE